MSTRPSSSDVSATNFHPEATSDEGLFRVFLLSLGASGRAEKTQVTYEESIRKLSDFLVSQTWTAPPFGTD